MWESKIERREEDSFKMQKGQRDFLIQLNVLYQLYYSTVAWENANKNEGRYQRKTEN